MSEPSRLRLSQLFEIDRGERQALIVAFFYFFALLASYYMLRSVREAMGVRFGPERYAGLYSATFACMLVAQPIYGALVSRFPRRIFVPVVYGFFLLCLGGFALSWTHTAAQDVIAPTFYVWLSVANLFLVVVFWSFMIDVFDPMQAKRLFGFIAAGGSAGGLFGAGITTVYGAQLDVDGVMWVAMAFLAAAIGCAIALGSRARAASHRPDADNLEASIGGTSFAAFRLVVERIPLRWLALLMILSGIGGGILYAQQGFMVRTLFAEDGERAAYFARIDFLANVLALLLEIFVARWLFLRAGVARLLTIMPLLLCVGFIILIGAPGAFAIALFQILSRGARFAFGEPALSACYTTLDRESRYKGKGFIDTFVYRFSDVLTQWSVLALRYLGAGSIGLYIFGAIMTLVAAAVAFMAGRGHERRADAASADVVRA